ncbi:helix-turn-helix domain-containing protein [Paremcibacter congregatus]|uniref:helix-turn-helix domain-containing protein n=1 Tax=Paremcibacter congregatus TaxID=2043170 RepID=UPI003A8D5A9C
MIQTNRQAASLPIGSMIKKRRQQLSLTLKQLSDKSGVSAPFISQAERNQTVPSMVSLVKLAEAMDVGVMYFMEVPHDDSIIKRAASPHRIEMDSPVDYIQLGSDLPDQKMDFILMNIPAGHAFPVDQREGEDCLYVLEGELYVETGDVKTVLTKGDSMHFDSRIPHTARNETRDTVQLLYAGTPSLFRK